MRQGAFNRTRLRLGRIQLAHRRSRLYDFSRQRSCARRIVSLRARLDFALCGFRRAFDVANLLVDLALHLPNARATRLGAFLRARRQTEQLLDVKPHEHVVRTLRARERSVRTQRASTNDAACGERSSRNRASRCGCLLLQAPCARVCAATSATCSFLCVLLRERAHERTNAVHASVHASPLCRPGRRRQPIRREFIPSPVPNRA
mmetsp:Transcript_399/g.1175  ORF Transcript_399/g.1175 Transcript_399/m.1175 type:complete len:205 (-) Transcript_399:439-1053(-)